MPEPRKGLISGSLVLYFFLAYLLSWIFWVPRLLIIAYPNSFPGINLISVLSDLFFLGVFGPLFSALIVIGFQKRKEGLREWGERCIKWRVDSRWYIIVFLLPLGIYFLADMVFLLFGGDLEVRLWDPLFIFIAFIYILFLGGGLEEPGWRGYAQPRLMEKWDALKSSIIIGVLWAFWHLPLFFIPGTSQYGIFFPGYVLFTVAIAILITWVYNNTQSILLCIFLHTMLNLSAGLLAPSLTDLTYGLILISILFALSCILLIIYGPETLTTKKD